MGQNGNGLKTDKNGNRTEIKRERNGITRPVVRMGDGNFFWCLPYVRTCVRACVYVHAECEVKNTTTAITSAEDRLGVGGFSHLKDSFDSFIPLPPLSFLLIPQRL